MKIKKWFKTCAKTGEGVDAVFKEVAQLVSETLETGDVGESDEALENEGDEGEKKKKQKSCC